MTRNIDRLIQKSGLIIWFIYSFKIPAVFADSPLTVEDLITDKDRVKLDVSLAYANIDRQGVSTSDPITVQTGPTSFVTLPTLIGENHDNNDSLVCTLGLRYGLTGKAEIFARTSYLHSSSRRSDVSGTSSNSDSSFADTWGVSIIS